MRANKSPMKLRTLSKDSLDEVAAGRGTILRGYKECMYCGDMIVSGDTSHGSYNASGNWVCIR